MTTSSGGAPTPSGGLFDGFEGYVTNSDEELRHALRTSLVVFDTNVLLNMYRYNAETRASIAEVMGALGDRLFVPHQVLEEFWRNRERALAEPLGQIRQSAEELQKLQNSSLEILRVWVNRAALDSQSAAEAETSLTRAFHQARALLDGLIDESEIQQARNTKQDQVLLILRDVLAGRVGPAMSAAAYAEAVAEGQKRAAAGEPPGFADVKKTDRGGEGAAGDYLVWEQLLLEAERRHLPVVFVTGDVKRDWWRYEGNNPRGPRIELVREMEARCGTPLVMMKPDTLLGFADALSVSVRPETVEDVERTSRSDALSEAVDDSTGWTQNALTLLMLQLAVEAPVQEATIRLACQQGGFVGRDDVYRLGDYEPERKLRGFTRPVNRLAQQLRESGTIPDHAADALVPVYDLQEHGFGWVDGFRVPAELVALMPD